MPAEAHTYDDYIGHERTCRMDLDARLFLLIDFSGHSDYDISTYIHSVNFTFTM